MTEEEGPLPPNATPFDAYKAIIDGCVDQTNNYGGHTFVAKFGVFSNAPSKRNSTSSSMINGLSSTEVELLVEICATSATVPSTTPLPKASASDDGYLCASEIAGLSLDADWVILSAYNTAAGDAKGSQALSGWLVHSLMPAPERCWSRIGTLRATRLSR